MIAVHTFGHLRTVLQCLDGFCEHVLAPLGEYDLFIHTWSETNRRTPSWYEVKVDIAPVGEDLVGRVRDRLRPAAMAVDEQVVDEADERLEYVSALKMHESIRRGVALRRGMQPAKDYRLVLFTRLDVAFRAPVDIAQFAEDVNRPPLERSVLCISRDHTSWSKSIWMSDRFGGRDVLFFGSQPTMDRFAEIGLDRRIYIRHPKHERTGEVAFDNFIYSQGLNLQVLNIISQDDWNVVRE